MKILFDTDKALPIGDRQLYQKKERTMQTKLTLQMDDELIARAKAQAKKRGKSVSQLVADYFRVLEKVEEQPPSRPKYGPITESLVGILKGAEVDEEDYYRYLEEKYLHGQTRRAR